MAIKVLGIERNVVIDFTDKKTKEKVHLEGMRLHLGEEGTKNVEGISTGCVNKNPLFVSNTRDYFNTCNSLQIGDTIKISYNRFHSVDYISKIE